MTKERIQVIENSQIQLVWVENGFQLNEQYDKATIEIEMKLLPMPDDHLNDLQYPYKM